LPLPLSLPLVGDLATPPRREAARRSVSAKNASTTDGAFPPPAASAAASTSAAAHTSVGAAVKVGTMARPSARSSGGGGSCDRHSRLEAQRRPLQGSAGGSEDAGRLLRRSRGR